MSFPKPLIKWLGGKTQLLPKLTEEFPTSMNNYHEIFIGGGSVLLALLTLKLNGTIRVEGTIFAYDANEPLIHLYKNVQSYPNELFAMIQTIITQMNLCLELESQEEKSRKRPTTLEEGLTSKENYYYWIRHQYNTLTHDEKKSLQGSSMFLFLNKTCFRGLFRLNSSGKYNVPYGHYKTPEIINLSHLLEISALIHHVVFECCDFSESLSRASCGDFVYMDPPYAPENHLSFVGYTETGFGIDKHKQLFAICRTLKEKHVHMIMSNADVQLVRENFTNDLFTITSILCKRTINAKNPAAQAKEVFVKNLLTQPCV